MSDKNTETVVMDEDLVKEIVEGRRPPEGDPSRLVRLGPSADAGADAGADEGADDGEAHAADRDVPGSDD